MKKTFKILKLLAVLIVFVVLIYRSATASKVAKLDEVSDLVFNEGYSAAKVLKMLNGVYCEDLADKWGKPDEKLSRPRGNVWNIGNDKQIIVYYSSDGYVENVIIDDIDGNGNDPILDENEYNNDNE